MKKDNIKNIVKESYAKIAEQGFSCGVPVNSSWVNTDSAQEISKKIGYSDEDLKSVPEGANLSLGCGNPVALASLRKGETVLDLGSGAGFDCFLASKKVGENGRVIGIDMTPQMVEKARENAKKGNYENVEFRLGEIENLPVADNSIDAIISNCVINLAPDKKRVFREAFRMLKPGGRLMISDIVLLRELSETIQNSIEMYAACIAGAVKKDEYLRAIKEAGFQDVKILNETFFPIEWMANNLVANIIAGSVVSLNVYGIKPSKIT